MKKCLSFLLALLMLVTAASSALALNYTQRATNDCTFETLEEAHANAEAFALASRVGATPTTAASFPPHPALDDYPAGTTYVYRSANLYGRTEAIRMNTNLLVYTDEAIEDKDSAFAYLEGLGLIDIINQATGSVVLVTPIDPAVGYGNADQMAYYLLQTAMFSSEYAEFAYFGGFGYRYVIGIGAGATFINEYVASNVDFVGRNAAMLLVNGSMQSIRDVAACVPVYLVNPTAIARDHYCKANGTDAYKTIGALEVDFNQQLPVRQVMTLKADEVDLRQVIHDAYYNLFIRSMRIPCLLQGLHSGGTAYQGYNYDEAPYALCQRHPIIDGKTDEGICLFERRGEQFKDIVFPRNGIDEYIDTWYEFLPEEVLNNTAPEHSVPLVLALHGNGDDPVQFVDNNGWLNMACENRFAIVAPYFQMLFTMTLDRIPLCKATCAVAHYMLDTYPALDPSRVYVAGYSMGGCATLHAAIEEPGLFAAAVPMSATPYNGTEEQLAQFEALDLPFMFTNSTFDLGGAYNSPVSMYSSRVLSFINLFLEFNEMPIIEKFDAENYPLSGFAGDLYVRKTLNGEFVNHTWYLNNEDGIPMVAMSCTEGLVHMLYPEYGKLGWEFLKHYSRDPETKEIIYNPYVD